MPMSEYLRALRSKVGHDLLLVPMIATLVFDDDSRVLVVRHAADELWSAPAGMPQPFETPAEAVVRTTLADTGLVVTPSRIVGVFGGMECSATYHDGDQVCFVATAFAARATGGVLRRDDARFQSRFVGAAEAADLPCYPHVAEMLDAGFAGEAAWFRPLSRRSGGTA